MNNHYRDPAVIDHRERPAYSDHLGLRLTPEQTEAAQALGTQVGLQCERGNYEAAYAIIERHKQRRRNSGPLLDTPLAECGVELSMVNALESELAVTTFGGAIETTDGELLCLRNVSEVRVRGLLRALLRYAVRQCLEGEVC